MGVRTEWEADAEISFEVDLPKLRGALRYYENEMARQYQCLTQRWNETPFLKRQRRLRWVAFARLARGVRADIATWEQKELRHAA